MIKHNSDFSNSDFVAFSRKNEVRISTFVLTELFIVAKRNNLNPTEQDIEKFVQLSHCKVIASRDKIDPKYEHYVYDHNDTQILQDALTSKATHLITNNTKDFKITEVFKDFSLKIISSIEEIY